MRALGCSLPCLCIKTALFTWGWANLFLGWQKHKKAFRKSTIIGYFLHEHSQMLNFLSEQVSRCKDSNNTYDYKVIVSHSNQDMKNLSTIIYDCQSNKIQNVDFCFNRFIMSSCLPYFWNDKWNIFSSKICTKFCFLTVYEKKIWWTHQTPFPPNSIFRKNAKIKCFFRFL